MDKHAIALAPAAGSASETRIVGGYVRPLTITEEMVIFASGNGKRGPLPMDAWHIARNLNAMMLKGYCPKCGLVPNGCEREGCGPNVHISKSSEK